MNHKMLALFGLKWNPFTPNVPTEALHVTTRLESFCWRVQQLAALADGEQPKPFSELRPSCRVRTTTLYECLAAMTTAGLVVKSADGYCLAIR